ncbi:MAG: GNAT family N-acetyltransferase [Planctomycetes bacterium]|nr:GNAT family N-acetyltransferase [Planctomycetota bacterium]
MPTAFNIRYFDARRDWPQFVALNFQTFRDSIPPGEMVDEEGFRRHHQWLMDHYAPADPARGTILVAELGTEYVGHCWLSSQTDFFTREDEAWVFDLTVAPKFRRQGAARALMAAAQAMAKSRGLRHIGLQVMGHNREAQALYAKLGFNVASYKLRMPI